VNNLHSNHVNDAHQHNIEAMDRTRSVPLLLKNVDKSIFMHQSTIKVRENVN